MNPHRAQLQHAVAVAAAATARPVDYAVVRRADMPDVVRAGESNTTNSALMVHQSASRQCHVCEVTCRHYTSAHDSSSSSSAAAADYHVVYASRDNAPLPDLVNVHRTPASAPYDRPPTSVIYHATTAVNQENVMPQPPVSPTRRFVRGASLSQSQSVYSRLLHQLL